MSVANQLSLGMPCVGLADTECIGGPPWPWSIYVDAGDLNSAFILRQPSP